MFPYNLMFHGIFLQQKLLSIFIVSLAVALFVSFILSMQVCAIIAYSILFHFVLRPPSPNTFHTHMAKNRGCVITYPIVQSRRQRFIRD